MRAIRSASFRKARSKAQAYARNPAKVKKLIEAAIHKSDGRRKGALSEIWDYLAAQIRLLGAYTRNDYRDVSWETLLLILAGLVYFVMPVDMIPDFIPVGGYFDDVAVISYVISSVKKELDQFMEWETRTRPPGM